MLDVLLLLAVPWGFLERLDDEGGCRGDNGDGGLTILDGESDGNTKTFLGGLLVISTTFGGDFFLWLWSREGEGY